jgi:glycosyltransferase involved in cell wall biosynthesis
MKENRTLVSVVVPTYNRGTDLGLVLDQLFASNRQGLGEVEIVVVDDGSAVPAARLVNARQPPAGFTLKCVLQENAGPAAARNRGFSISHGEIVIFIDDDVLVSPELIGQHVEAHQLNPGAVIFGGCAPPRNTRKQVGELLDSLYGNSPERPRFERVSIIASGQISVERNSFQDGVYASQLRTPAAEEFELSARLELLGIPAIFATEIQAIHDQRFGIPDICDQQYKHGMGCAEAVCKLPQALIMNELARIATVNGPILPGDPWPAKCKKLAKSMVAAPLLRRSLISLCGVIYHVVPNRRMTAWLLWFLVGVSFLAGYRKGLALFGPSA